MIIRLRKAIHFLIAVVAVAWCGGCSSDLSDSPIPTTTFPDIVIQLNLPEYNSLHTDGGWKYIGSGVRGIIIYRLNSEAYYAFERNCSYHPADACATVNVHSSNLYMVDPCCQSTFDFTGQPTGGPAWRPLNQYLTKLSGSTLTITDAIR